MAKHTCKNCGIIFESNLHTVYCEKCRQVVKKTVYCNVCNQPFEVGFGKNGQFLQTKICPDCSKPKTKTLICKNCGKKFTVGRYDNDDKHFLNRSLCDECLKAKTYSKICITCGKPFITTNKKRVNCDSCKNQKLQTKTLICKNCGKEFTVERRHDDKGFYYRKLCEDCLKPKNNRELICKYCGKSFTVDRYNLHKDKLNEFKKIQYCSDECRNKSREEKRKALYLKKYGVPYYFNTDEYKNKVKKTCQDKYGVDFPCMSKNCVEAQGSIISTINKNFALFLKDKNINYEQEFNLHAYSYDFKVGNTLIEINPTYTHTCINTELYKAKPKNYHINKTKYANSAGYRCINVWEWEDWNKIYDLIKPKQKIYARKLILKEVNKKEANEFINLYHLQGSCYGNMINLGLYKNDELIQIMTFGKPRYNKNYQWELLRLCTKSINYVVGGAEKLFKHFITEYKPESIISYCDVSKFSGDVYERLGFSLIRITEPQKIWSKYKTKMYITDNLLRQRGADQLIGTHDGKGTNNEEIMFREGWLPIYDCGQKVFEWKQGQKSKNDIMSVENKEEFKSESK